MAGRLLVPRLRAATRPPANRPALAILARVAAGLAALVALFAIAGYAFDTPALTRFGDGPSAMRFNTAVVVILLAASCVVAHQVARAAVIGIAVALVAAQLVEYATGVDLHVDVVAGPTSGAHPGRTSIAAAVCLLAVAVARMPGLARRRRVAEPLALLVLVLSGLSLLGFAYGTDSLHELLGFTSIALPTSLAIALLGIAVLARVTDGGLPWVLNSDDPGATLLRTQLPLIIVGLPVIGLLGLVIERAGWVDVEMAVTLVVALFTLVVGVVSWRAARRLAVLDDRREDTLRDLTDLKNDLERQVSDRVAQLQNRRDEIAVLEDRQRIAADLHDLVIQRLFAAGMFLQGSDAPDADTQRRIDTAVESMDTAIKELRASIFELGGHVRLGTDVSTALDDVCNESARILGFRPDLTVDDPDAEAEAVRDDLLAVLREALSNVARHAQASKVEVVLRTGSGLIGLSIIDDGVGISEPPHSSGTRNIAERARQNGGECDWLTVRPHGTRVWWRVPGRAPIVERRANESVRIAATDPLASDSLHPLRVGPRTPQVLGD